MTETVTRFPGQRVTVVLVEDDPNDATLIKMAFERTAGEMGLVHLTDGDAAVTYLAAEGLFEERAHSHTPMLMLLDIKLPRRSGFDVLKWARSQPAPISHLPILMLTSSAETADVDRAFELGATAYIRKPSRTRLLSEMVGDLKNFWVKWTELPEV